MEVTPRITPQQARERVQSGQALLICAYDDEEKFKALHLENALSLKQFREIQSGVPKEKELIFYCA